MSMIEPILVFVLALSFVSYDMNTAWVVIDVHDGFRHSLMFRVILAVTGVMLPPLGILHGAFVVSEMYEDG